MPTQSRATIKVVPQQHVLPTSTKVHFEANYDVARVRPNDCHIYIRELSSFRKKWQKVRDISVHFGGVLPLPVTGDFDKPADPGTYDIRVVFTLDGVPMDDAERTGQFFVDP